MWNKKKWLAAILIIALSFENCGGITALAAENAANTETSLSENTVISDEESEIGSEDSKNDILSDSSTENDTSEEASALPDTESVPETEGTEEMDTKTKLPALHIGQIPEGETLPSADDASFFYDLPLSFETAKNLILFTNYEIEMTSGYKETGTLTWSILRGEKGLEAGSASLLDEEDDWNGFEEVFASPFFTMEEITDKKSDYYEMMALVPEVVFSSTAGRENRDAKESYENYVYYIRAAYYMETGSGKADNFYAAATVPFLPLDNTGADQNSEGPDSADVEELPTDAAQDTSSVSENSSASENNADTLSGNDLVETDTLPAHEDRADEMSDNADSETDGIEQTAETLSENSIMADASTPAEASEQPPLENSWDGSLSLYKGTETTAINEKKDKIAMIPGDTQLITAKANSETTLTDIVWESSDETVATVTKGENGTATITAVPKGYGYAKITASYHGVTASATVDVVRDKDQPDSEKLLDLSGDIRVAGFEKESDELVYNGQKITQSFRVYHKNTLLKEKTDYTLSYKNNVNAAKWNAAKAPSVTIKLKGQYQGSVTLYYTIKPLDINDIDIYNTPKVSPAYEQTVNYSKKLNIPAPVLNFGKKKLAVKKDFICDYTTPGKDMTAMPADYKNGDLYKEGTIYSYTVNGTGNFTGSFPMTFVVLKDKKLNFSSASVKLDQKQYEYHGKSLTEDDVHITEVKLGGQVLEKALYQYKVYASGIEGAYLMLSPTPDGNTAGYHGCKKVTLKLVGDRQLRAAARGADWKESIPFSQKIVDKNGGMFQTGSALLSYGEGTEKTTLVEGTDYTVKYGNAKKAGKVSATFTGKGRYKGTLRLSYTITPNIEIKIYSGKNVVNKNGTYEVAYQKDGAVPDLILKDADYTVLKNKTDYTIKYKDNKTPGTPMTCEIKGKGNYRGYEKTVTLTVTKADIGNCTITIPDKPYNDKPNKWKSTVTIKDVNGKKLTAGKDYDKNFTYSHTQESSPQRDTVVTVTVTGMGCYEGSSITGTYRIFAKNISTLKVVIDPQEYTGEEITLTPVEDIHLYANNTDAKKKQNEIKNECYKIIEYKNNIKAGTAKVTLQGTGEYGATKTYSFKIQKKQYLINHVKGITLDKTSLKCSLVTQDTDRMLTATITPEDSSKVVANPTVIWSSSNSKIATVEPAQTNTGSNPQNPLTSSAIIFAKKAGTVTITATTQDKNKKVTCKVTISIPTLTQANQTITGKVGDTYQLTLDGNENEEIRSDSITFKSDNPNVVSVSESGLLSMQKMGAATITVTIGDSNVQHCYVIVEGSIADPENDSRVLVYHQAAGCTDDTPYINKMLRDWEWGSSTKYDCLYLPEGVYHIDATADGDDVLGNYKFGGIVLTDNQTLIMSPDAELVAIGNNKANSQIIFAFGRKNVVISGGKLIGERNSHSGTSGEWGHGINIAGCTNVYIRDVNISECWGDGIYLGKYDNTALGNPSSNGVTITNCNLHHNRRNNLSITDVNNVTVNNCEFNYASGTDPQYGIDIEPNRGRTCSNVTISNSSFKGNAKGTIQILGQLNAHVKDVTIENCTGDKAPVKWSGFGGSVSGVKEKGNKWG